MKELIYIILATFINSLIALIGILGLLINEKILNKAVKYLVGLATGTLLGGSFFHLFPEALKGLSYFLSAGLLVAGFVIFFFIESLLHWHHCKETDGKCKLRNRKAFVDLVLFGDGLHNFIDGVVIAASFLVSLPFGIVTTLLIISHEVPQEVGDFGVLVYGGLKRKKAIFYNFISQLSCVLGGVIGYFASSVYSLTLYFLPIAAGGFIYIAASDLIPELHKERLQLSSLIFFLLGIFIMIVAKLLIE
jgi:zinc and cadmium transporter